MLDLVAKKLFLTKGVGVADDKLTSFEFALRQAGIAGTNIVLISSIFPPNAKLIPRKDGLKLIKPGQILFTIYSRKNEMESGDYAEDIAAQMLASSLGIPFDIDKSWDEKRQQWTISGQIYKTKNITQSAKGNKDGKWTTVFAAAVLIL